MLATTSGDQRLLYDVLARSGRDAALRERLLAEPRAALESAGIALPADIEVRPVEATETVRYLLLPTAPEEGAIPDEDLEDAAGGASPIIVIGVTPLALLGVLLVSCVALAVAEAVD